MVLAEFDASVKRMEHHQGGGTRLADRSVQRESFDFGSPRFPERSSAIDRL
jgi:predicted NAD/FAD-dependent oxidoreductase